MRNVKYLIKRNVKLFFKDKGTFLTSLIAPLILLFLFVTFLGNVYRESFRAVLPIGAEVDKKLLEGFVGGWLFSSLLAVCCVTVAFCSNMRMVEDKANGARCDLDMTPVRPSELALGYYLSTVIVTLIICFCALGICMIYLSVVGWYLSVLDVLLAILDVILLVMFGTALSSIVGYFLHTQGQIAAVGSVVSSCYGFVSGAYMPISQFSAGLQDLISFLPGTYGTVLLRRHLMGGALAEMENDGFSPEFVDGMRDAFDNHLYFFEHRVTEAQMYAVLFTTVLVLIGIYVAIHWIRKKSADNA